MFIFFPRHGTNYRWAVLEPSQSLDRPHQFSTDSENTTATKDGHGNPHAKTINGRSPLRNHWSPIETSPSQNSAHLADKGAAVPSDGAPGRSVAFYGKKCFWSWETSATRWILRHIWNCLKMRSLNIHTHILSLKEDAINRKKPLWVSKIIGVPISGKMMQNDGIYSRARLRDSIDLQNWSMLVFNHFIWRRALR